MGLKDGTLKDLLLDPHLAQVPDRDERVAKLVIRHMLQALDFLSVHGIVHRDVKPENILYTRTSGVNEDECLFQLGDFGLSNRQSVAKSVAGTEIYMAPEVKRGAKQTSKADVWSLFVTVLWVLNANFRQLEETNSIIYEQVLVDVQAATMDQLQKIREMARVNPEARASAAQIHLRLFGAQGLTTTRIPPILPEPEIRPGPSPASTFSPPADVKGQWPAAATSPDNAAREAGTGWTVARQVAASNPFGVGAKARAAQRELWRPHGN